MHDNKNKYTFRKHKAYGLVGAMFATALMATPGALGQVPMIGGLFSVGSVKADTYNIQDFMYLPEVARIVEFDNSISNNTEGHYGTYSSNTRQENFVVTVPKKKIYEKDATRDKGAQNITKTAGSDGTLNLYRNISTSRLNMGESPIYTGDQGVVSRRGRTQIESYDPMTPETILVAAKDTDEVIVNAKAPTQYVKDPSREKGAENITTQGKDATTTTHITYDVNRDTGEITENRGIPTIVFAEPKIVKVAAKDKVETIQRGRQTVEKTHK